MKTKISLSALSVLSLIFAIISCKKTDLSSDDGGPYLSAPIIPDRPYDYKNSSNDNLANLGRVLFYDKNLSINNSVSCAGCHQQKRAFCDNEQFSSGVEDLKTTRNTPSIFAKQGPVFWDGRASSMADLALRPIKNHVEMKFENLQSLVEKLSKLDYYSQLSLKATGNSKIDTNLIRAALAEFLKNFTFSENKFSKSRIKTTVLSASESLGESLFFGKARCFMCHHIEGGNGTNGYGSTDESHNIGLNAVYADNGLGTSFGNSTLNGAFMVPALLNVEYTAPYMHDGRFKTLEEVVEHYNSGVQDHPNLDIILRDIGNIEEFEEDEFIIKFDKNHNGILENSEIQAIPPVKLNLSTVEKRSLVDFLRTLSDPSIFDDVKFSNPFQYK